jgi:rhodanese-related sulfurtransferase
MSYNLPGMTTREKLSVTLVLIGIILAILPLRTTRTLAGSPESVLMQSFSQNSGYSVDQVARMLVSEDSTLHLIDIRPANEFREFSIPGAINIPYTELIDRDPATYMLTGNAKNVFYSNGSLNAGYAIIIAGGLGYNNCAIMKGGINEWITTVLNTRFSGDVITARENALFETRARATKLFSEFNALPDSLKTKYLDSKRFDPKKLDGGCE